MPPRKPIRTTARLPPGWLTFCALRWHFEIMRRAIGRCAIVMSGFTPESRPRRKLAAALRHGGNTLATVTDVISLPSASVMTMESGKSPPPRTLSATISRMDFKASACAAARSGSSSPSSSRLSFRLGESGNRNEALELQPRSQPSLPTFNASLQHRYGCVCSLFDINIKSPKCPLSVISRHVRCIWVCPL